MTLLQKSSICFVVFCLLASLNPGAWAADPSAPPAPDQGTTTIKLLIRRVQFLSADVVTHFRYMDTKPGTVTARDEYYKLGTRVQINLLGDGRTYIQARGESGRAFNASYDYTGLGLSKGYWSYNLKSL